MGGLLGRTELEGYLFGHTVGGGRVGGSGLGGVQRAILDGVILREPLAKHYSYRVKIHLGIDAAMS